MPYIFCLPDIGEGIAEAEIVRWLVAVGDVVAEDDPVAQVETDKALVEMPSPAAGRVLELGGEEGARIRVGDRLIVIDDGRDAGAASEAGEPIGQFVGADSDAIATDGTSSTSCDATSPGRRPAATPATRRLARELGVSLAGVTGSGRGGRIEDTDVRAVAAWSGDGTDSGDNVAGGPHPPAAEVAASSQDQRIPLRGLRRRTAEAMAAAMRDIPHTVAMYQADVVDLLALRKALMPRAQTAGVALTLTPFLVKATALALARFPMANASFDAEAGEIIVRGRRNIGVAVNGPEGLVIPVVKDADRKPVLAIARELEALTTAARNRTVALVDLQGGTFTISNHGPLGGNFGTPIIRAPEGGIIGFGKATPQAVVRDGEIVARTTLPISYSADHRLVDGDVVIPFSLALVALLEDPVQLLVEEGC
ncbi:dihydrolipoamide acetyltransferase family protein [Streptomyces sp. NPDC058321]|uniref:dihydrolipoamide acetyltransferase family protein n=1 Tax=Streptomyces sp. NPDC058321 TaxID=3346445 RepID=UPI0036E514F0